MAEQYSSKGDKIYNFIVTSQTSSKARQFVGSMGRRELKKEARQNHQPQMLLVLILKYSISDIFMLKLQKHLYFYFNLNFNK